MCLQYRHSLDPRTRRIFVAGQLLLVAANLLFLFGQDLTHSYPEPMHALRGFFLGLALVFLIWSAHRAKAARA